MHSKGGRVAPLGSFCAENAQGRTSVVPTRESIPCDPSSESEASVHPLETKAHPGLGLGLETPAVKKTASYVQVCPEPTLSEVFRHSGWSHHRLAVYQALWRTNQSLSRLLNFQGCGAEVFVLRSPGDPPTFRLSGIYCHDRVCLPCANDRARTISRNLLAALPGKRVRFLTLTITDRTPKLGEKLTKLRDSFAKLQRSELWKRRVTGGAAFLEVKRSERSANWHVHYHVLITGRYIPHADLSHTWYNITGDSFIVDIRPGGSLTAVSKYVTKYASKPLSADVLRSPPLLDEAIVALHGRRLCQTFGGLRGVKLTENPTDDTWEQIGTLDDFLRRERDGETEAAYILMTLRSDRLDDARQYLFDHPDPPPIEAPPYQRKFPLFDAMIPAWMTGFALCHGM